MNQQLIFAVLLLNFCTQSVGAEQVLHGKVEDSAAPRRLQRPIAPSNTPSINTSALSPKQKTEGGKASIQHSLDEKTFLFDPKAPKKDEKHQGVGKNLSASVDDADKDMVIAWEDWHKRVCTEIYDIWLKYGNIPGEGTVELHVGKDGAIDFNLKDFHVDSSEQQYTAQEKMFEQSVDRTVHSIDHASVLAFPEGSARKDITFSTKFCHSTQLSGRAQGYSWKKGDYEKITR